MRRTNPGDDADNELRRALLAHASLLLAFFERRVGPGGDAADLLAETMLQAWRRASDLPTGDPGHQRAWLYTMASHVLSNHRRSVRRRTHLTERLRQHLEVSASQTADALVGLADAVAIRDAVKRLNKEQRELVTLVHWDGLTLTEAARAVGINPSTARSRYATARGNLRTTLTDRPRVAMHPGETLAD